MENAEIMGIVALIVSVGGTILGIINHKRIRSNCCGKNITASFDVESTTPTVAPVKAPAVVSVD